MKINEKEEFVEHEDLVICEKCGCDKVYLYIKSIIDDATAFCSKCGERLIQ